MADTRTLVNQTISVKTEFCQFRLNVARAASEMSSEGEKLFFNVFKGDVIDTQTRTKRSVSCKLLVSLHESYKL